MRYDDRLATVLGQPAADARGRAVQWRQLVELLSRGEGEISQDLVDRALARIAQLMKDLPLDLVSATSRAIAGRSVPAELVAMFAARGAAASAALLTAADLSSAGWKAVRSVAADDVVPILSAMGHASPSTPPPVIVRAPEVARAPVRPKPAPRHDPVHVGGVAVPQPFDLSSEVRVELPPPQTLPNGVFRWETGPTGEIDWVEGVSRAAMIGRSVADAFTDTFAARLPFADAPLSLAEEGQLAGEWRWSGTPAFFPDTGRFAGYRGFARREGRFIDPPQELAPAFLPADDVGLRELMHELRTPLNAIIGFGEIIEGQYLGPAHRAYRDRAAEIVKQARGLSDAVDNLDLAARLRSDRLSGESRSGTDTIHSAIAAAGDEAATRDVGLRVDDRAKDVPIGLPPMLVERLVQQFASAMTGFAVAGEELKVIVGRLNSSVTIEIDRAAGLRDLSEEQILGQSGQGGRQFALRLVRGLAATAGGRLEFRSDRVALLLPLAN